VDTFYCKDLTFVDVSINRVILARIGLFKDLWMSFYLGKRINSLNILSKTLFQERTLLYLY